MASRYDGNSGKRGSIALLTALGAAAMVVAAGPAHAEPVSTSTSSEQTAPAPVPGIPMPVADGSLGYIATPAATRWMHERRPADIIANLPVGNARDNRALADRLGGELDAAVAEPGACLQIIVGGPRDGGLFSYGFYAVEPAYCPR